MRTLLFSSIALLLFSCGQNSQSGNAQTKRANLDSLKSVVQSFDNKAMTAERGQISQQEIKGVVQACLTLGDSLKDNNEKVKYFVKAGNIAGSARMANEVKRSFEAALSLENDPAKLALIHFQFGFISDEFLKQFDVAQREYEIIISDFAASEWADDAQLALSQLGKSDEQILRELKEKNASITKK
jgi:hypothetical protein